MDGEMFGNCVLLEKWIEIIDCKLDGAMGTTWGVLLGEQPGVYY